ncbi:MAG: NFACT family protein [Candidatus Micrarchaeota archaeon]
MQVPNVTLKFLVDELNASIAGARVTKIQAIGPQELKFKLLTNSGSAELVVSTAAVFITNHRYPSTEDIQFLVEFLKKHLEGKKIATIKQVNSDRILQIQFEHFSVVCEMFAKGNIILVNSDGIIETSLAKEEWKDRKISKGETYKPPSSQSVLQEITAIKLEKLFSESEKKIVPALVEKLNVYALLAEEAVLQSKVPKEKNAKELGQVEIKSVLENLKNFFSEKMKAEPVLLKTEPNVLLPFELPLIAAEKKAEFESVESFSKALDDDYCSRFEKPAETKPVSKRVLQLEKSLIEQQKTRSELEQKAAEHTQIGEAIFSHYAQVKEILAAAKTAKQNGFSEKDAMEKFSRAAKQGSNSAQKVVSLDFKKNRLVVELL